ncbi:hypothetical protein [Streptacidiphilus jiangxiensis]|uniref:Uncharacterized protein n=1 Tax=Streptacidiphilus jiangxiensis TaxID=235985 RepID=A0A1H7NZK3_STRJI|nr:hypothetical protein [Streptacidiphilus jiangxiensis]SEL28816.1 hypothetical protein SAMN05414137_107143 [Streptacidiphilus jiangxiensis]
MVSGVGARTVGAIGTEHGFFARKYLVEVGVDPDDLRLDDPRHGDRAVAPALAALAPLKSGLADEPCRAAVRHVAEVGTPAAAASPLLRATLESDRCFPADIYPAARAALTAFADGRGSSRART